MKVVDLDPISIAAIILFLATPFLHRLQFPWTFLDSLVVRLVLLVAVLYSITRGALPGLFAALALVSLYFERNLHRLATSLPAGTPSTYLYKGSPVLPLAPSTETVDFVPHTDGGVIEEEVATGETAIYEEAPEASGLDHKVVLDEAPRGDQAASFFERLGAPITALTN
jgi:hypothetical protein